MNSDNTKKIDFLRHDINQHTDYQLVKSNKSIYNLPKHQIYGQHHSTLHDFTINCKNTISNTPFNGSSSWYADFELPSLNYCYHQFVLRFLLTNNSQTNDISILPFPLCIDRITILKNSNVLNEVYGEDILLFNLHKISNKYNTSHNDFDYNCSMGLSYHATSYLTGPVIPKQGSNTAVNMEIPLCLTQSNFLASAIKNQLTIRIYFKGNIITSATGLNSELKLDNLKLMLRMRETSHNLIKEPKFNHQFTKRILTKINIPKLEANQNYTVNLQGFNSVASFAFLFIREQDNAIRNGDIGESNYSLYNYQLDNINICDSTGKNILQSDIVLQKDYNRYLLSENFGQFAWILNKMTKYYNDGNIMFLPFCYDGNLSFNHQYNGGYKFNSGSDYQLKFTSILGSNNRSVLLNIVWFSPSILSLENGDVSEHMS